MYLAVASAQQLMVTLSQMSRPGSWLGLDVIQKPTPTSRQLRALRTEQAHTTTGGRFGVEEPQGWLLDLGWKASISTLEETGRRYGRWPTPAAGSARAGLPGVVLGAAQREETQRHPALMGDVR